MARARARARDQNTINGVTNLTGWVTKILRHRSSYAKASD